MSDRAYGWYLAALCVVFVIVYIVGVVTLALAPL